MELLLYLAGFILWQCVVYTPPEGLLVTGWLGALRARRGPCLRVASPFPSDLTLAPSALPFELANGRLYASSPLRRFGQLDPPEPSRWVDLQAARSTEASGTLVKVAGRGFVRASSNEQARSISQLISDLADSSSPEARLDAHLEASLSRSRAEDAFEEARTATAWLRALCSGLLVAIFVAVPATALAIDDDRAWLVLGPALGLLDLGALVALHRVHRRLRPEAVAERRELLIVCALYPPSLLRTPQVLVDGNLASFHPVVVAALLLGDGEQLALLRRELARLEHPPWRRLEGEMDTAARRRFLSRLRAALLRLGEELGFPREALIEPENCDPQAVSFCPLCFDDFREGYSRCDGCGLPTTPY
ncbi:MAG: hypothetical protein ABFS46_17200, partial [Myxococcota bacterium]